MNTLRIYVTGEVDVYFTAGETIAANAPVYVELNNAIGTAASVYNTNATTTAQSSLSFYVGIAIIASTAGNPIKVRVQGLVNNFSGLTTGSIQYASTSSGGRTESAPTNALILGVATSATQMLVNTRGDLVSPVLRNTNQFGYFAGGATTTAVLVATTDKILYSTDTTSAQTTANLTTVRRGVAGVTGNVTKGYFCGGQTSTLTSVNTADKVTYSSNATAAQTTANITSNRNAPGGVSELSTKAYICGGSTTTAVCVVTTDKITYSSDATAAATAANISFQRQQLGSLSEGNTKGYVAGGVTDSGTILAAITDKITFSTDITTAITSGNLSVARSGLSGISAGDNYGKGYFMGGRTATTAAGAQVLTDKITFSTDVTAAQVSANLPVAKVNAGSLTEGNTKGYISGGASGLATAIVATGNTITFSSDTTAAATTVNLTAAKYFVAGLGAGTP